MSKLEVMTKFKITPDASFVILVSPLIRHSSFVIRHF